MTLPETVGIAWILFTAALSHIGILYCAYKHVRNEYELARRGEIEQQRDVVEAAKLRTGLYMEAR